MTQFETVFSDQYGNVYVRPDNGAPGYWRKINPDKLPHGYLRGFIMTTVEESPVEPTKIYSFEGLLQQRGAEYSDAWILTTEVVEVITRTHPNLIKSLVNDGPYLLSWITILCKLIRAVTTPTKADHWRDIAGYATLVADHIETGSRGRL